MATKDMINKEKRSKAVNIRMKPSEHKKLSKEAKVKKVSLSKLLIESALTLLNKK